MAAPEGNDFAVGNPGGGRPSSYKPEFAPIAEKMCELGATDTEIAEAFGVSVRTIHSWKHEFDEFSACLKAGKALADERVERGLYQKATGYDYTEEQAIKVKVEAHKEEVEVVEVKRHAPAETTAAIFWLKNRRRDQWRDKQEVDMNVSYADMSEEELRAAAMKLALEIKGG
jgi:hypothetical protein